MARGCSAGTGEEGGIEVLPFTSMEGMDLA